MIELTLELYLQNKRLIKGSDEDMQIGISNLISLKVSDAVIIAIAKSLDSSDRFNFIRSFVNAENWNTEAEIMERTNDLRDKCKPWSDLFQILKKGSISNIEKRIVEYEITMLYLGSMSSKNFVKKINLELAW
tara:strand:- start:864 stop:1262 length:399 start_codon:yes stop_codon:yes gene_type:complete